MRRNIHYKPSKSASILSGIIACAMGVFGLFAIPSIGAMIGFKAIWCLMTFGMGKSDAEARLEELQTLYDRRLITEEEYQEKRKDILDRL